MSYAENTIEFVLTHKFEIQNAVNEERASISGGGHTGGNGSGHSRVSDPTAIQALREITAIPAIEIPFGPIIAGHRENWTLRRPEKWLKVATQVQQFYSDNPRMARFYRSRYISNDLWQKTCHDLKIRRGTYYAMRADVIHHAELYAVHYGVLSPCDYGLKIL